MLAATASLPSGKDGEHGRAVALGFIVGIGTVLMAGLRRLAWRYAVVEAVGVGLVFALLRGWPGISADVAVLLAAIGGALASLAFERGERDRQRRVAEILRGSSIPG